MKRKSLFVFALVGIVLLLSNCEKDASSTALIVDESQTATLKLYVKADLDTATGLEDAPDGTQFLITIKKSDLNGAFTGDGTWTKSATVADGELSLSVPTTSDGVPVIIDAIAFEKNYVVSSTVTEKRVYDFHDTLGVRTAGTNNVYSITMDHDVLETITK